MSRSGYSEDLLQWDMIRWRGRIASATRGKRGQEFFHGLISALDALPEKRLIKSELVSGNECCAIGSLLRKDHDLTDVDPEDHERLGTLANIPACLVQEVECINDDDFGYLDETPEHRWTRVREWAVKQLDI